MTLYRAGDLRTMSQCRSIVLPILLATALLLPLPALAGGDDDRDSGDHDREFIQPGAIDAAIRRQAPDGELVGILRQVDRRRLEQTVRTLVGFGTRHTASSADLTATRGIGAATSFVFNQLQALAAGSGGRMTVALQQFVQPVAARIPVPTTIRNVVATIAGSASPTRTYVITAYLDSRVTDVLNFTSDAPGADSDASGVAAVLELARIFAAYQPKATIILAVVGGKEQGLYGSTFQAAQFKAAGTDIEGMFSVDRIGSSLAEDGTRDRQTLRLFSEGVATTESVSQRAVRIAIGGENDGVSRQLGRFAVSVAENSHTDMRIRHIYRRDSVLRTSDQVSYLSQGYPAARFAEPHENFAHEGADVAVVSGVQFGDLPDFLDFEYLARATKVCAAVIWSLTQGPAAPKNVFIDASSVSNDSNLNWDAGSESDLVGYEVVWRETSDEDWSHAIPLGNVTSAHLPHFSKDNVFFGVRAIDSGGHHSPVTFPQPK